MNWYTSLGSVMKAVEEEVEEEVEDTSTLLMV